MFSYGSITFPLCSTTSFSHHPAWWSPGPGLAGMTAGLVLPHPEESTVQGEAIGRHPQFCSQQNEHCFSGEGEPRASLLVITRGSCRVGWDPRSPGDGESSGHRALFFPSSALIQQEALTESRSRLEAFFAKLSCRNQRCIGTFR